MVGGGAGLRGGGGRVGGRGVALGPRAGARVRRYGDPREDLTPTTLGPCHAHAGGFDLHAGLTVRAGQRDRLERLCRYTLRPPLAQERLHGTSEGEIWLTLRHRWTDGTTHLRCDPLELLERLAVLTSRPRVNLILYYGVLARAPPGGPRLDWRPQTMSMPRAGNHPGSLTGTRAARRFHRPAARINGRS